MLEKLDGLEVSVIFKDGPDDTYGVGVVSNTETQLIPQVKLKILLIGMQNLAKVIEGDLVSKESLAEFIVKEFKSMPEGAPGSDMKA